MANHQYMIDLTNDGEPIITFVDLTGDSDDEPMMDTSDDPGSSDDEQHIPFINGPGPVSAPLVINGAVCSNSNWAVRTSKAETVVGPSEIFTNPEGLDIFGQHIFPHLESKAHGSIRLVCTSAYKGCPRVCKKFNINLCYKRTVFYEQLQFIKLIKPSPEQLTFAVAADVNNTIWQRAMHDMGLHGMCFDKVSHLTYLVALLCAWLTYLDALMCALLHAAIMLCR